MENYDLLVIGAGWAGFNASIRAAQLGLKVLLCDNDKLGGTCLNYGCIPTKTLLFSAKIYSLSQKSAQYGLDLGKPSFFFQKMQERKEKIILKLRSGMQYLLKTKNLTFLNANAFIKSSEEVFLGDNPVRTKHILIASGSKPLEPPFLKFDNNKILSSTELLNLQKLPQSILIIGGGVIGCEFASLFNALGSEVSIVELMPNLLPQEDKEVSTRLESIFKKRGVKIHTNADARSFNLDDYEIILVSVGRVPNTADLGLDNVGLHLEKGKIPVDGYQKTNIPNIYAAGDCTGGIMLAHAASYQGKIAAENIAAQGAARRAEVEHIPNCIFTQPEIGRVGLTEEEARARGFDIKINKFDFQGSGMAHILDETEGFIKIISDKKTKVLLGASIIGPKATELIGILTFAIQSGLKINQLQSTLFAHPTLSECIVDALRPDE